MAIEFVDELPPSISRGAPRVWQGRLAPVMERKGKWARVHTSPTTGAANTCATNLRKGIYKAPPGQWEFAVRDCDVYAKYLGE